MSGERGVKCYGLGKGAVEDFDSVSCSMEIKNMSCLTWQSWKEKGI